MSNDNDSTDSKINITLNKVIGYPIGILLILAGLGVLLGSLLGGFLLLLAGLISLPIVRQKLEDKKGIIINNWATLALVLILWIAGFGMLSVAPNEDIGLNADGSSQPIEQPSSELVPTIDDFESGWKGGVHQDGSAYYENVETGNTVDYNVTKFDSTEEAEARLKELRPTQRATSNVSLGDGGFIYPFSSAGFRVRFQERNVICRVFYRTDSSSESAAENIAQKCVRSINR